MLDRNNTESSRFNVHKAAVVLISMMAFFLPFMVFAIPIKGEGIEPANLIGLILIILNTSLFIYTGRIRRMNISEKMFLLYFGVACLSVVASQLIYGWPEQLIIGIKQLIGIFFMLFIFFSVSWYIRTPATFLQAVTWLWWGSVILALLGLWQFLALNFLKTSFLANYEWAANLNPSIGGWRWPGAMGPVIRVNSFAAEPANYCYFLLGSMGLVTFRLFPPPGVQGTPWKVFLPTTGLALIMILAYLLSFSILGYFGLVCLIISYALLFRRISFKRLFQVFVLLIIVGAGLNYITEGKLLDKFITIKMILPGQDIYTRSTSALSLAANLVVTYKNFLANPILGCGVGGTPITFYLYAPKWALADETLSVVGAHGAPSLALRLISEMGLVGLVVFCSAFFVVIRRAWLAVQEAGDSLDNVRIMPLCAGLTVGTLALGILMLLRSGTYYRMVFWFLLAVTSVIPEVLDHGRQNRSPHPNGLASPGRPS